MLYKKVQRNLINNKTGLIHFADVEDHFFMTSGTWNYRMDPSTGHCWLDPRPADESISSIYESYYTHKDPNYDDCENQGLWKQSLAWAQSRKLGYPLPEETSLIPKLVSFMPTVANAATLELMKVHSDEKGRLLDVGCGDGSFLKKMRKLGWDVVGMEPDVNAAARLIKNDNITVYSSIEDLLSGEKNEFDVVVLNHVLEHLPDPVDTLKQLTLLMKPSSRLIATTPNISGLGARIFGRFWRGLEPPRHFNLFSPKSIELAFTSADLNLVSLTTEVRMARSIWYLSYLARSGRKSLEIKRTNQHKFLKFCGYVYQLFEALVVKIFPGLGEELFCVGVTCRTDNAEKTKNRKTE